MMDYDEFIAKVRLRETRIRDLRKQGRTLQEIGNLYGITAERVRQILLRQKKEAPAPDFTAPEKREARA